jgi:hypothetical protein
VNAVLAPSHGAGIDARWRRRTKTADAAIVLSTAAALAHVVATPDHYTWWPAAGLFFAALGLIQLLFSVVLARGTTDHRFVLAGIWGTVAVILLYVASRTVGLPMTPPVPFHGGRWVAGRSMVPDGAKHIGPLDVFTLVAEVLLVVTLLSMLPSRSKLRTANRLMWVGFALWGAGYAFLI